MKNSLIDTVKFAINIQHGNFLKKQKQLHAKGVLTPITRACAKFGYIQKFKVPGPYGSTATVWSKHKGATLLIECSAPKFLGGQNVFGSNNLREITLKISRNVCKFLDIKPTDDENTALEDGEFRLYRIDLAAHIKLPPGILVANFIEALKMQLVFTQRSFSVYFDETLYINQSSDMKTLKIYDKGKEILVHPIHENAPDKSTVENYAKNLLRVEMTFRNRHLRGFHMSRVSDFDIKRARKFMKAEIKGLGLTDQSLLQNDIGDGLGNLQRCLVALHASCVDLKTVITNYRQLKIHANHIFKTTGVNILIPQKSLLLSPIPVKSHMEGLRFLKNN